MLKKLFILTALALVSHLHAYGDNYKFISIKVDSPEKKSLIKNLNLDLDGAIFQKKELQVYINEKELDKLKRNNLEYSVLINDVSAYYRERYKNYEKEHKSQILENGFTLGSFAGYYTLPEIYSIFNQLKLDYPNLVSDSIKIGESVEKRPIYAYRVGENNAGAAEVLVTALHHAREGGGVTNIVYYIKDILKKYSNNESPAKYILANRNIWLIPVVNPDGYEYNRQTNPDGGGMWRKNRRDNLDGEFGVDLNRNYGPLSNWDSPFGSSSDNSFEDVYRGTAPFSEPETQAVRNFCLGKNFKFAVNFHTYGNMIVYPYGEYPYETRDSNIIRANCLEVSRVNKYSFGTDIQTVGYSARGASDDWMYSTDGGKNKTIAVTPETGFLRDGFWATADRIIAQARDNAHLLETFIWSAVSNIRLADYSFDNNNNQGSLDITLKNIGISDYSDKAIIYLKPFTDDYSASPDSIVFSGLKSGEKLNSTFKINYLKNFISSDKKNFLLEIKQNGISRFDTIDIKGGIRLDTCLFCDNSDMVNWNSGIWESVYSSHLSKDLFEYKSNVNNLDYVNTAECIKEIDLSGYNNAELEFNGKWLIDFIFNGITIEASINGGNTWKVLQCNRSIPANAYGPQTKLAYRDNVFLGSLPVFTKHQASLKDFCGNKLRIRLVSHYSVYSEAVEQFSLYDLKIKAYKNTIINSYPEEKSLVYKPEIILYPNPIINGEELKVAINSDINSQVGVSFEIYNSNGAIVFEEMANRIGYLQEFPLNIKSLSSGAYYIIVGINGEKYKYNFVKE